MGLSRIFQSDTFLEVIEVMWHLNRGVSCNSRGDDNPPPKSNLTASTLAPRTIQDWHLKDTDRAPRHIPGSSGFNLTTFD